MGIVGGLDIHRHQITFNYLDTDSGEVARGKIAPADRQHVALWLGRFAGGPTWPSPSRGAPGGASSSTSSGASGPGPIWQSRPIRPRSGAASSGPRPTTPTRACCANSWLWVACPNLGSPPRTSSRSGPGCGSTRRWPTSAGGGCKGSEPPSSIKGSPPSPLTCSMRRARAISSRRRSSRSGRESVEVALRQIERLDIELACLRGGVGGLRQPSDRLPGPAVSLRDRCSALGGHLGGDGRLPAFRLLLRRRAPRRPRRDGMGLGLQATQGHLTRQGSGILRWALDEAGLAVAKGTSPDHDYYLGVRERLGPSRPPFRSDESSDGAVITRCGAWATTPWRRPDQRLPYG